MQNDECGGIAGKVREQPKKILPTSGETRLNSDAGSLVKVDRLQCDT